MPVPKKNKQIKRSSMRDEVYETLLEWIMRGVLLPGEKLLDKELAESLGVSRTPVREAFKRLEDKGYIKTSASRWTRVAGISISEAEMIYPVIGALEELAVSMAMPGLTDKDFAEMEQANADLKEAIKARDPDKSSKADAHFHDVIIKKSENHHLANILRDLKLKHRRLELIYFNGCVCASDSVNEHGQIIAALKVKDIERAARLVQLNWMKTVGKLKELSGV
jgi:DNA-binding GntR family transcriptional regulator